VADETDPQPEWRPTRAKLLARRGQFPAARQLVAEAEALLSPASSALGQATMLVAKAEVNRLTGDLNQAAASLRAALRIYEDRRATALAGQVRTALASLTAQPGGEPV
jgi:ATP/maltotriose-dependent transcriptional regulator MalT